MADDIFQGDRKMDQAEPQESFGHAFKHLGKGLKVLFFKKFYMNLFFMLLLIAVAVALTSTLKGGQLITGQTVLECPEINCTEPEPCPEPEECPEAEECEDCHELDCSDCEEKTTIEYVYRYRCPNGAIVNDSDDCVGGFPETDPAYTSTANGITLALDDVYYEKDEDSNTKIIRQVNYTIINRGSVDILPKVCLKVYERYTQEVKEAGCLRTFKLEELVDVDDWVKRAENMYVDFEEDEMTVRLELIDMLPDPDKDVTTVFKRIEFD